MSESEMHVPGASTLEPLVQPEWLEEPPSDPDLCLVEATVQVKLWPFPRIRSGRREFKRRHIPGAAFVDQLELTDPDAPAHTVTMPGAKQFAGYMVVLASGKVHA